MGDCLTGLQTDLTSNLDTNALVFDIRATVTNNLGGGVANSPELLVKLRTREFEGSLRAHLAQLDQAIGSPGISPGAKRELARERSKIRLLHDVSQEFRVSSETDRLPVIKDEWRQKFANPRYFGKTFPVDTSKIMEIIDLDLAKPVLRVLRFPAKGYRAGVKQTSFEADTVQIHRAIKLLEQSPSNSVAPVLKNMQGFRDFDYQEWLKGYPDTGGGTKQRLLKALKEVAGQDRPPDITPPLIRPVLKPPVVEPAPSLLPPLRFPEIELIPDRHDFLEFLDEMMPDRKSYEALKLDPQRLRYEEQWEGRGVFANDEYKQAWLDYTRSDYRPINQGMRRGEWADPKYRAVADKLQEAIDSSAPLPVKRVYRGQDDDIVGPTLKPGDRFRDDGFVSTSDDFSTGRDFAGRPGSSSKIQNKSLYVIEPNEAMAKRGVVAGNQSESEWILPPGSTFKVGKIIEYETTGGGKHRIIHLEWDGVETKPKVRVRSTEDSDYGRLQRDLPELQEELKVMRRVYSGQLMTSRDKFYPTFRVEASGHQFLSKIQNTGAVIDREVKARVAKSLVTDPSPIDFDYEINFAKLQLAEANQIILDLPPLGGAKRSEEYERAFQEVSANNRKLRQLAQDQKRDARNRERDAYLAVMTELRGELAQGGELRFSGTMTESQRPLRKALRQAAQMFPKDWMQSVARRFPNLKAQKSARGFFSIKREPTISVSPRLGVHQGVAASDGAEFFEVGVHELAHAVEESVEGIKLAEHVFYWHRVGRVETTRKLHGEPGRPDRFFEPYVGRDYGGGQRDPYELLSMMSEWRMGGMSYNVDDPDVEMLRWLYGVMALL